MASKNLEGLKVAILAANGFEQVELTEPRKALDEAGAETKIVSPEKGKVRGWKSTDWGDEVKVDLSLEKVKAEEFDALLLPGGVMNPDKLRMIPEAVAFVKSFFDSGKPVGRDLSRSLDGDRSGSGDGPADYLVAVAEDRSAQCRRQLGGPGDGERQKSGDQPKPG